MSQNHFLRMIRTVWISCFQSAMHNVFFFNALCAKGVKTQNYRFWLQKRVKSLCGQLFKTHDQKLRSISFYIFVSNINHMFQSDVTVLTLISNEFVWSDQLYSDDSYITKIRFFEIQIIFQNKTTFVIWKCFLIVKNAFKHGLWKFKYCETMR